VLTFAHTAWKSTSAPLFFCTSGKETVENLKISPGQLAPCQEKRIKRQQTLRSDGCQVLVPNAGFLLASMFSYCRFKPIEYSYSQSVSIFVPQDKLRGSAIRCERVCEPRLSYPVVSTFLLLTRSVGPAPFVKPERTPTLLGCAYICHVDNVARVSATCAKWRHCWLCSDRLHRRETHAVM